MVSRTVFVGLLITLTAIEAKEAVVVESTQDELDNLTPTGRNTMVNGVHTFPGDNPPNEDRAEIFFVAGDPEAQIIRKRRQNRGYGGYRRRPNGGFRPNGGHHHHSHRPYYRPHHHHRPRREGRIGDFDGIGQQAV